MFMNLIKTIELLSAGKNVGGPHDPEAFAKFGEGENIVTHGPGVTAAVVINMIEQGWVAEKANYHGRYKPAGNSGPKAY